MQGGEKNGDLCCHCEADRGSLGTGMSFFPGVKRESFRVFRNKELDSASSAE